MITLQEYLNQQFPTQQEKEQLKEITIGWRDEFKSNLPLIQEQAQKLEGRELDLSEYPNLEKVWFFGNYLNSPLTKLELGKKLELTELVCSRNQLTSLNLTKCPNLKELYCWENQITKLELGKLEKLTNLVCSSNQLAEIKLPSEEKLEVLNCSDNKLIFLNLDNCSKLKTLCCYGNQLTELKISHLTNLTVLGCSGNQLTRLNLPNSNQISWINCNDNYLTDLSFLSTLSSEKMTGSLNLHSNNFPEQDLAVFSRFVNLEKFYVNNLNEEKIKKGVYNRFKGSLEALRNMTKLKNLDISNTDINSGLEYLPDSIEKFGCLVDKRKEAKSRTIYNLFINDQGKIETEEVSDGNKYIKNFPQKLQWIKLGFSEEERNSWMTAGAKLDDAEFVAWFKNTKNLTPEWITDYQEDYQILSKRFKKYGLCSECNQLNTGEQWCQACNKSRLEAIALPASNNPQINQFIQQYQLEATDANKFIEWIPYEQFTDIEYLAQGGFGKVYKAKWSAGNIYYWDTKNNQWQRKKDNHDEKQQLTQQKEGLQNQIKTFTSLIKEKLKSKSKYFDSKHEKREEKINSLFQKLPSAQEKFIEHLENIKPKLSQKLTKEEINNLYQDNLELNQLQEKLENLLKINWQTVVLKCLANSSENTNFLDETAKHKIIDDWFDNIVPCYGLSRSSDDNHLMVMQYMPEGNLRKYLGNKNKELTLENKINHLAKIAQGLKDIHAKNLVHRDFHSGNILKGIEQTSCLITDLGLCKPVNEASEEDKIFGVMPYVASEVLLSQPYTQVSDVYSFGIVAYEMLSGLPPYYDRNHDLQLALEIINGLRPQSQIKIPPLLEDLIKRCWNIDPLKRPTAQELEKILKKWQEEINRKESTKFAQQLQEAEEHNKTLPEHIKFPKYKIHQRASYHSKLLPTKEITQLLQNSQLILQQNQTSELISKQLIKINKLEEEIKQNSSKPKTLELINYFLEKSKELTKELEEIITINPQISEEGKEVLKKIKKLKDKLKTQNNKLSEESSVFKEQRKEIDYLEARVQELAKLIEQKKEKIVDIFKRLLPDKEKELSLIQNLVVAHLEFTKASKKKLPSVALRRQRDKIRDELEELLGDSLEEEIQLALVDFEELVSWELELEEKFNKKSLLLGEQITENKEEKSKKYKAIQQKGQKQFQETVFWESYWRNQLSKVEELVKKQNYESSTKKNTILNWTSVNPNFTEELIQNWTSYEFNYQQTQEWINIGLNPNDYQFANWLKNEIKLTPEELLNDSSRLEDLRQEFINYQQNNQQAQIVQTNFPNN